MVYGEFYGKHNQKYYLQKVITFSWRNSTLRVLALIEYVSTVYTTLNLDFGY